MESVQVTLIHVCMQLHRAGCPEPALADAELVFGFRRSRQTEDEFTVDSQIKDRNGNV